MRNAENPSPFGLGFPGRSVPRLEEKVNEVGYERMQRMPSEGK